MRCLTAPSIPKPVTIHCAKQSSQSTAPNWFHVFLVRTAQMKSQTSLDDTGVRQCNSQDQTVRCAGEMLFATTVRAEFRKRKRTGVSRRRSCRRASIFCAQVLLTTWFRFPAVIEEQETVLVFSTPYAVIATCSKLILVLAGKVRWSQTGETCPSHARAFAGFDLEAEIRRNRSFKRPAQPPRNELFTYPQLS